MIVLGVFAESRQKTIIKALREKTDWPAQWLTDVNTSYAVLARHPFGNETQVVAHYDFLRYLGANNQATQVLDAGLARFPKSWSLHDRLRGRILADKGLDALEATYEAMLAEKDAPLNLEWFAGLASIVTAEFHQKAGHLALSKAAYDLAQTVDSALQNLDPKLLLPPASEGEGPPQIGSRAARRQRGR